MDLSCLQVLLISICSMLCTALPFTYRKPGESSVRLYNKFFPDEKRSNQEEWRKDEHSMFRPSLERSKFQSAYDQELRDILLQDILYMSKRRLKQVKEKQDTNGKRETRRCHQNGCIPGDEPLKEAEIRLELERRRLEQTEKSQGAMDKREPQRCTQAGCYHGDDSLEEAESWPKLGLTKREHEHAQMNEMDIEDIKQYDMELEKELRNLRDSRPYIAPSQM